MTTLLVTRFLCGFFGVAPLTNSMGVIADIWDPVNRGIATSVFIASCFLGPATGPAVGSVCAFPFSLHISSEIDVLYSHSTSNDLGWRWVFLVMMLFAGSCTLLAVFVPETYAPVLLARKAKHLRAKDPAKNGDLYAASERVDWTLKAILQRTIFRPFKMLLVEPILLLTTIYVSLAYGVMYASMCADSFLPEERDVLTFCFVYSVRGGAFDLRPHASLFGDT